MHKDDFDVLHKVFLAAGYPEGKVKRVMFDSAELNDESRVVGLNLLKFDSISLCRALKQIKTLKSLSFIEFQDMPTDIGSLENLIELDLSRGKFSYLPPSIGQLKNLEMLDISCTKNLVALPHEIGNLTNLQSLYLSYTHSLSSLPAAIGKLKNLKTLHLEVARNLVALPHEIGNLTNLQSLDLYSTNLTSLPDAIGQLKNLETLNLSYSKNLEALPYEIGNLTNLQSLDLTYTNLTRLPAAIGQLTSLETLVLTRSNIESLPASIGCLQNLHCLDLDHTERLSCLPEEIGNLRNLNRFTLFLSNVQSLPPSAKNHMSYILARRMACSIDWEFAEFRHDEDDDYGKFRQNQIILLPSCTFKIFPYLVKNARRPFEFWCSDKSSCISHYCIKDYEIPEPDAIYLLLLWARESFIRLLVNVRQLSDQERSDASVFRYEYGWRSKERLEKKVQSKTA